MAPSAASGKRASTGRPRSSTTQHRDERRQRVHLGAAAGRHGDGRSARAAAHREPAQQARADVGHAKREELLIGIHRFAAAREGPPGQHNVAERDDQHGQRREQQLTDDRSLQVRQFRHRQARRNGTDQRHPVAVQAEERRRSGAQQHGNERPGQPGPARPYHEQEDQDAGRDGGAARPHLAQLTRERADLRDEAPAR